jgi:hypothetical protein
VRHSIFVLFSGCLLCYHVITLVCEGQMAEWTVGGFKITMYKADHPPLHCHVRKDRDFIGKFNLETNTWMTGPRRHKAQANAAIARWRRKYGI